MIMQNFWGIKEVYYGIVQVVNSPKPGDHKIVCFNKQILN